MNIGIFYGSNSGNTEAVANKIAQKLGIPSANVHNVASANAEELSKYDCLLFGSSTWGFGDLQDDWEAFIKRAKAVNLAGKKVALFGCGDSYSYDSTFCNALGIIRDELAQTGCSFIGEVNPADLGYSSIGSEVCKDGRMVGLAIDEDNEIDRTDIRIEAWISTFSAELQ